MSCKKIPFSSFVIFKAYLLYTTIYNGKNNGDSIIDTLDRLSIQNSDLKRYQTDTLFLKITVSKCRIHSQSHKMNTSCKQIS